VTKAYIRNAYPEFLLKRKPANNKKYYEVQDEYEDISNPSQ